MKRKLKNRFFVGYGVAFLVVVLTLLVSYDSSAQGNRPAAGIKGGLNVSNLYTGDVDDRDARYGFNVGVFGQPVASDVAALQLELLYSTKGTKAVTDGLIDQETKFNLNYLDLPVLAVFKLGKAMEIHAGAYGSYLLGASIDSDGDLGDTFDEVDKDNFNSVDYGVLGGIGFNLGGVQIGGRYNLGLNEIAKSRSAKNVFGNAKNQFAQLYIAFNLNYDGAEE
ncbi:porin family protein [Pseudochryseolinea flava]|uniref:PorT family protein n=1 Tax=Pseudochryseolinea flava TaxID=2059302 RepID=A0A364Y3Q2_9BACT|nr:porin family protein [Pseudochryseolinea flava]RAW01440.1 PorT family protein [Pseudochryseolinea flava]